MSLKTLTHSRSRSHSRSQSHSSQFDENSPTCVRCRENVEHEIGHCVSCKKMCMARVNPHRGNDKCDKPKDLVMKHDLHDSDYCEYHNEVIEGECGHAVTRGKASMCYGKCYKCAQ